MVLLSKKALETKDAKELFAWLKAQGDKASVGFAGVGSNSYICATLLQQQLGVKLAMVPYRGTGPAMIDLVAGQIDVLCDQATTAVPQIQGGTVKAYAVTSTERLDSIKDVPSAKEAGLPDFNVTIWNGLYAPKGVPKEVVDKVNAAVGKMVTDATVLERFAATGTQPFPADDALAGRAREVPDGRVRALRGHVQGGRRDAAGGEVAARLRDLACCFER